RSIVNREIGGGSTPRTCRGSRGADNAGRRRGGEMLMSYTRKDRRHPTTGILLIALLVIGTATAAGAHPNVAKWWQYDKSTWQHSWWEYPQYRQENKAWESSHPRADQQDTQREHRRMRNQYRQSHFHRGISWQQGQATWYDGHGQSGACGKPLVGLYAAS